MSDGDNPTPSLNEGDRPGWPFTFVLFLAIAVWMSALLPCDSVTRLLGTGQPTSEPRVIFGKATDLAGAIRRVPRAVVYVDEPTSTCSAVGRLKFLDATNSLANETSLPQVRFFVVEEQYAPETRVWMDSLADERLDLLGRRMKGYGGLIWLEFGRVVEADDAVGQPDTDPKIESRTLTLWKREP